MDRPGYHTDIDKQVGLVVYESRHTDHKPYMYY